MSEAEKTEKTTFYLPTSLLREFKAECAKQGRTMTAVVRDLVEKWIQEQQTGVAGR
jgi:predicted DNA-binding protein